MVRDPAVAGLLADLELVAGLMAGPAVDATLRALAGRALERAMDVLDAYGVDVAAIREPLLRVLDLPAAASAHRVSAAGHAHIDSAWLWPLRETRRKVARTVANVLQLMDTDDDLVYVMSAAQHWEWLREDHPALFERAARGSPRAGSCRSAGCGWSPTRCCPAARRWPGSSPRGSGSSASTSARSRGWPGCPTRSATPARCRRS